MAHRVTKSNGLHLLSQRTPLHLRTSISRARPHHACQVRQLWWWGRHRNEWTSFDENMEERVRRHERILRHRYSKMLRRRALWERDVSSRLSWPWKSSNRWLAGHVSDAQNLSSSPSPRTKAEEHRHDNSRKDSPLTTFHRDFESFKKAVDRAIERDPYGTLFGRRLQSPPSANNSSWTSFSWIFDPKEIKEARVEPEKTQSVSSSEGSAGPTSSPKPIPLAESYSMNASRIPTSQSVPTNEYEYDPISMRKVPKTRPEFQSPLPQPPEPPKRLVPTIERRFETEG